MHNLYDIERVVPHRDTLRLVDRLVHRGLVRRSADPADRRLVLVCLTEAGAERQRQIGRRHARSVARAMAPLDVTELRQLRAIATKLAEATEAEPKRALA